MKSTKKLHLHEKVDKTLQSEIDIEDMYPKLSATMVNPRAPGK